MSMNVLRIGEFLLFTKVAKEKEIETPTMKRNIGWMVSTQ